MKPPVDRLRLGQARAEVAELREQLDAANALLDAIQREMRGTPNVSAVLVLLSKRAHLAAQPATAPADAHVPRPELDGRTPREMMLPGYAQPATAPARDEGEGRE